MRRYIVLGWLLLVVFKLNAQQYALFNTKTLFDSFENPAQKSFVLDSSRQIASNFLIPYLDLSSLNKGDSRIAIRNLVNAGYNESRVGDFSNPKTIHENINIYLLSVRLFQYHKYHSEMGFSWQIKTEAKTDYDENISRGLFYGTFNRFLTFPLINIFNNNGKLQAYHQISFNYRENYNKQWALGAKVSLLSGIGYAEFYADRSSVALTPATQKMNIDMAAKYRLNYPEDGDFTLSNSLPYKNLGAAITLGTTYTTKSGIFLMANIKDLGFIRWGKKSYAGTFDITKEVDVATGPSAEKNLQRALNNIATENVAQKAFIAPINSRADFLISKTLGPYTPNLIVSKNIFDKYGEAALVNTLKSGSFSFSMVPAYTTDKNLKLGLQGMIETPNFEMFLGTNDLMQTYYAGKDITKNDQTTETGYNRASVYLGMAFKIGYVVEHPMNMSWMPGVGADKDKKSFFGRIFGIFKKKKKD